MKLLLDTCVLSELRTSYGDPAVKNYINTFPDASLLLSVITVGEVAKGVSLLPESPKKQSLADWLRKFSTHFEDRILPIDQEAAEIWGELTARAQKEGVQVPVADGLIAATAIRHGLHVATRNDAHFEAAGAMVVNPWLAASPPIR